MPSHLAADEGRSGGSFLGTLATVVACVVLAVLLRTFVVGAYEVPSGSMRETIREGDLILGEKVSLAFRDPEPGDIVTFDDPLTEGRTLVKRVIAVGGQTVDLVEGRVVVDGVVLDEPYTDGQPSYPLEGYAGSEAISYPFTVPEGCIWVMGDNRTNSADSRYFGPVSVDEVTSRVVLIYWPLEHISPL